MIQITKAQANIILHNMLWKIIKADYPPSKDEQDTIKYLQDEVNKNLVQPDVSGWINVNEAKPSIGQKIIAKNLGSPSRISDVWEGEYSVMEKYGYHCCDNKPFVEWMAR